MPDVDIKTGSVEWLQRVRGAMTRSLHALDITTPTIEVDDYFYRLCYKAAAAKGCLEDERMSPFPYLATGAALAQTAYAHVERQETRVYMALWVAFVAPIDDSYSKGAGGFMDDFIARMTSGQPQAYPHLERLAAHLREASLHFDAGRAAIFVASTFNWVISLDVDAAMLNREIPPTCLRFPTWCSIMSGLSEATAMPIFPPQVPLYVFAPVIPDMNIVIRNYNDIFSFYKEELAEDPLNQIPRLAKMRGTQKLQVLDAITDKAISVHKGICDALAVDAAAQTAWMAFMKGYAEYHYAAKRYRLHELE